ncbi:MAG: putative GTP-binding protein EngB [Myxococcales bacterium]
MTRVPSCGRVDYVKGGTAPDHYPDADLPEVAFVGRSNVGKSTLINVLTNRRGLARTSNTPGRTQQLNWFRVDDRLLLADLPGYGYAKVPVSVKRAWRPMIDTYLTKRQNLRLVIVILDIRREPGAEEHELIEWLQERQRPTLLAVTKIDKFAKNQRYARYKAIAEDLGLSRDHLFPFSGLSGEGREALWEAIVDVTERD